jgi:serine protease AprX
MSKRKPAAKARKGRSRTLPPPRTQDIRTDQSPLEESNPKKSPFNPETLDRTVIAIPLLRDLEEERTGRKPPKIHSIIIDLNLEFPGGRNRAREYVEQKMEEVLEGLGDKRDPKEGVRDKTGVTESDAEVRTRARGVEQYLFARLGGEAIRRLVSEDSKKDDALKKKLIGKSPFSRAIYHIWPDFPVRRLTDKSVSTVKADAARASFSAFGDGIVWAVLDSGIQADHPHFKLHSNLELKAPLVPMDFTGEKNTTTDPKGHGTHVAGIIAGEMRVEPSTGTKKGAARSKKKGVIRAAVSSRNEHGESTYSEIEVSAISGMAPKCKLLNLRVLDENGEGEVSSIIAAIAHIQELNGYGRRLLIHGVNLSVGNDFEPEWFACGHSPLCVEVNRLVQSGVVVVVAAGNSGYGSLKSEFTGTINTGIALTINDPGNADLAITVGSTHREMPHMYGVSYFSSKGPTGDGRLKPDLVAPGEKIISCAAGESRQNVKDEGGVDCDYVEDSGTSMAAPHVSGVIAAFLSVRREFIGYPERVKEIFLATATDLKRERYFQGNGLVDLMRAIQSV